MPLRMLPVLLKKPAPFVGKQRGKPLGISTKTESALIVAQWISLENTWCLT